MAEKKHVGHGQHLKAVNHPIRKEILKLIYKKDDKMISRDILFESLKERNLVDDENIFSYNTDILIHAQCIEKIQQEGNQYFALLPGGQVIENWLD